MCLQLGFDLLPYPRMAAYTTPMGPFTLSGGWMWADSRSVLRNRVKLKISAKSSGNHFTFIYFDFACFVATLNAKNDEGNIRWGCRHVDPNTQSSSIGWSNLCRKHRWCKSKMTSFSIPEPKASKRASNFTLEVRIQDLLRINQECKMRPPATEGKKKETSYKLGDKLEDAGRQAGRQDGPSNKGKQEGRQAGRKAGRQVGDKLADKLGDNGDKVSGRWAHHPTKGNKEGDKVGREDGKTSCETRETRPREGGHTILQRKTRRKTRQAGKQAARQAGRQARGDKRETRSGEGGHSIEQRHTCGETLRDTRRQDLEKAGTPSNKGTHVGRQGETRPKNPLQHTVWRRKTKWTVNGKTHRYVPTSTTWPQHGP